eukprot:4220316-Karenia_brevis.AAC.1
MADSSGGLTGETPEGGPFNLDQEVNERCFHQKHAQVFTGFDGTGISDNKTDYFRKQYQLFEPSRNHL